MAARLAHPSATPTSIDLQLVSQEEQPGILKTEHPTAGGGMLRYIRGPRVRRSTCVFALRNDTEYDNFFNFLQSAELANTRFTFTPDVTNFPGRTYTAFFLGGASFQNVRIPREVMGFVTTEIIDQPVTL